MSKPNETQIAWLKTLAGMGGGGGSVALLTAAQESQFHAGPIGAALGNQTTLTATPAPGSLKLAGGGQPTGAAFVPDLEISGGPKRELAVGGKFTLNLRIRNWAKRPKGTTFDWTVNSSDVIDFDLERVDGEGTITVTGMKPGRDVMKVEVKVKDGGTYKFTDTLFVVYPTAKDASTFVPELEVPRASKQQIAIGGEATVHLNVRNWDKRPKGTILDWTLRSSGEAADFVLDHKGGEGASTLTLKGLKPSQGVAKVEVKVKGGGTYAFSDIAFTVADEGGFGSVIDVEQDMRNILQDWKSATADGIQQFATNALSARLDKLESGSANSFLASLVGNTIWAAAAFSTGGIAFAIGMGGIAVAAAPTVPEERKSFIPTIQQGMVDHIYEIYDQLDKSLRKRAQALADSQPGMSRFEALATFVTASFKKGFYTIDPKNTKIPTLNKSAIRNLYEHEATQKLDEAIKADEARKKAEKDKKTMEYYKRHARRGIGEV